MKRNSLTTALLAGLAGAAGLASTAQAVNLNPDGLGQVLVYPYYTVEDGNQTLISVVNTTNRAKGVKVRFLEGKNSREVLDFNLYLSRFDVWVGSVFALANTGPANLVTPDNSCTVPAIKGNTLLPNLVNGLQYVPFRNFNYSGTRDDNGGTEIERTREGYLEMIEMGLLNPGGASTQLEEEATHTSSNVPANCGALIAAWTPPSGGWVVNSRADISLPAGGLFGAGAIVDTANGTMNSYNADAIEGFYSNTSDPGFLHTNPGSTRPNLGDANNRSDGSNMADSFVFLSGGTLQQDTWTTGTFDAVSAIYMHDAIYNEFTTENSLGAQSEWVITFPTKNYYVDSDTPPAIPPFTDVFQDDGKACEVIGITTWNREEQSLGSAPGTIDFSPPPPGVAPGKPRLCFEAQVIGFNQGVRIGAGLGSAIFGSTYAANITTLVGSPPGAVAQSGWTRIVFDDPAVAGFQNSYDSNERGNIYIGLPVTGFWAANFINANAQPGLLANYSSAFRHRASRNILPPAIVP